MEKTGLSRNQIIQQLTRSSHGDLKSYVAPGLAAASEDGEFFAHLIAWNEKNGQIRDSKVALPVVSLAAKTFNSELAENSLAHLALLDPRNLVRALKFAMDVKTPGHAGELRRLVVRYLRERENDSARWQRTAVQHRASLKTLYALFHVKPSSLADRVLFKGEKLGIFKTIAELKDMASADAASAIIQLRIPFLIAVGALGGKAKEPDLVLALIQQMSPTELVTNTKMLEKLGAKNSPALRAAFEEGLKKAVASKKTTFKTTRAVEALTDDALKEKLRGVQEKQIDTLGGVEGDWLVLADKSPSMQSAIAAATQLAATLARIVKGQVHLVFFDGSPHRYVDATGKAYDTLLAETKHIKAGGSGTSIGCGLQYALDKLLECDGIAVVSDGAENTAPFFATTYNKYCAQFGKEVPVYLYWMECHEPSPYGNNPKTLADNMAREGLDLQVFDLREGFDYYALPNICLTMRTQRYSLIDAIMSVPLLKLADVFK